MSLLPPKASPPPSRFTRRASRRLPVLLIPLALALGFASGASAQLFGNPDWKEAAVPPPPAFEPRRMIEIDMPRTLDLKFGVDPDTLSIGPDGVVRYVIIAKNTGPGPGGAMNAFYEGIRCATGEGKIYARFSGDAWHEVESAEWKSLNQMRSRHALALARQAVCRSAAPRETTGEMVRELRKPDYY